MENFIIKKFRAQVFDNNQLLTAINIDNYEYIIAPLELLDKKTPQKSRIIILPPVFLGGHEKEIRIKLLNLKKQGFQHLMVHTIAHIALAREAELIAHGSFRLNITNSLAFSEYEVMGLADAVCSIELNLGKARALKTNIPLGIFAYGRIPLMVARRCPVCDNKVCDLQTEDILKTKLKKKKSAFAGSGGCRNIITDRKGKSFSMTCDTSVEILNPDVLWLADKQDKLKRFDFLYLSFSKGDNIKSITNGYLQGFPPQVVLNPEKKAIDFNESHKKRSADGLPAKFTRGLYFRSVE